MKFIQQTVFLFMLTALLAPQGLGQVCGYGFKTVKVSDVKNKNVPGVAIEIVAELPNIEEYYERLKYSAVIKMPAPDVRTLIKRNPPKTFKLDYCANPLRQQAGKTKIKYKEPLRDDHKGLGFCSYEPVFAPLLLQVSAPGYVTDYYVGNFLGGCRFVYDLVLIKK